MCVACFLRCIAMSLSASDLKCLFSDCRNILLDNFAQTIISQHNVSDLKLITFIACTLYTYIYYGLICGQWQCQGLTFFLFFLFPFY